MSKNCLPQYNELHKGGRLVSNNGEWKAVLQDDGNFVVYGWKCVWATKTHATGHVSLVMQNDCNLVMYNESGGCLWHSNTAKRDGSKCYLELTDDGILVLYRVKDMETTQMWRSDKGRSPDYRY